MIITSTKHGRTARDCANLVAHLLKPENSTCEVIIGGSVAEDLADLVRDMQILRDGSSCEAALHHFTVNPALDHPKDKLIAAVHRVRREFDPSADRPWAIVIHGKPRAGSDTGTTHAHLVLGHVDGSGHALDDKWSKIRTERLARELEFDLGEPATLGRHHGPVLKHLRQTRPEVERWLTYALGARSEKPRSAISSQARRRALRADFDLPAAKALIRSQWAAAEDVAAFQLALAVHDIEVVPGQQDRVWVCRHQSGVLIGALDRLVKFDRLEAHVMMETRGRPARPLR